MRHGSGSVTLTGHCSSHEGPQGPVQTSAAKSATRGGLKGFGSVARASKPGAKAALDAGQQAARGERSDRGAGLAVCPMRGCAKADRRWAIAGRDGHCAAPGAAGGVSPPCVAVVWHLRGVCASSAACQDPVREVPLQNETPRPHAKPVVRAKHTLGDEESGALARRGDRATKKARGAEQLLSSSVPGTTLCTRILVLVLRTKYMRRKCRLPIRLAPGYEYIRDRCARKPRPTSHTSAALVTFTSDCWFVARFQDYRLRNPSGASSDSRDMVRSTQGLRHSARLQYRPCRPRSELHDADRAARGQIFGRHLLVQDPPFFSSTQPAPWGRADCRLSPIVRSTSPQRPSGLIY